MQLNGKKEHLYLLAFTFEIEFYLTFYLSIIILSFFITITLMI